MTQRGGAVGAQRAPADATLLWWADNSERKPITKNELQLGQHVEFARSPRQWLGRLQFPPTVQKQEH